MPPRYRLAALVLLLPFVFAVSAGVQAAVAETLSSGDLIAATLVVASPLAIAAPVESQTGPRKLSLLTDFSSSSPDFGWHVVNDNVMGGRSEGGFEPDSDGLVFSGSTNTNGGGFSSIRTGTLDLDLSAYSGIQARVKGDGRRYTWRLVTDALWRGRPVGYWAEFETEDGEWRDVQIPFSSFRPTFRGSELEGMPLDSAKISGMGLMIYDGKDGSFEIRLSRVEAYRDDP